MYVSIKNIYDLTFSDAEASKIMGFKVLTVEDYNVSNKCVQLLVASSW